MRKGVLWSVLAGLLLPLASCGKEDLTIVGVMYHQWWVPSRWSDSPRNHPYEPVLGHYDNASAGIVQQHVAWAKQYGITTFVFDFWITDRDWWWVDRNTRAVADILDREGLNYFFLIDGWFEFLGQANPPYEIAWRVNARAAPYFNRAGYLKQNGRPVVFFWAASQSNCDTFNAVRAGIEGTSGPIFMTGDPWNAPDPWACFDVRMDYNPYISGCGENDYECQLDHQDDMWRDRSGDRKPWAPTALPGYDDHYVRPGNPTLTLNADFFRKSIQTALRYRQYHDDGTKWLFVCSWSEWHEGSQIEPSSSFEDPEFLLKVLKNEVDNYRSGALGHSTKAPGHEGL
jgi:glycoprotein endo-alpha-1,2-mannosidase